MSFAHQAVGRIFMMNVIRQMNKNVTKISQNIQNALVMGFSCLASQPIV